MKTDSNSAAATAAAAAANLIKTTAETTATALNIQYIQRDILDIKTSLKEMINNFVTKEEYKLVTDSQTDHETRIRGVESNILRWGGAIAVIAFSVPILLKIFLK